VGEVLLLAAHGAGGPVLAPEIVEHGAADPEFGVGLELDAPVRDEFVDGVDQAEDAGVDEVVDFDGGGQTSGKALRDVPYEGRVLFDEFIAGGLGAVAGGNGRPPV